MKFTGGLIAGVIMVSGCNFTKVGFNSEPELQELRLLRKAPPPDTITVEVKNYCPAQGRSFRNLFVSNFSTRVYQGELLLDTDRDGVPDRTEEKFASTLGLSKNAYDTNNNGYSDLTRYLAGLDLLQQSFLRCDDVGDDDGDGIFYDDPQTGQTGRFVGLNNCEEKRLSKTNSADFDSDKDGIPDYLELRCNLNPKDPVDAQIITSNDGISNLEKCKRNIPIDESYDNPAIPLHEYRYSQQFNSNSNCFDFKITNIPVLNKGDGNFIALYLTEQSGSLQNYLYTAFHVLQGNVVGSTVMIQFGPHPAGRFIAK